jgi:hypothetical protein
MTAHDPAQRLRAQDYLDASLGELFPLCFETFLYPLFRSFLFEALREPDARVWAVCENFGKIALGLTGRADPEGERAFAGLCRARASGAAGFGGEARPRSARPSRPASMALPRSRLPSAAPTAEALSDLIRQLDALSRGEGWQRPASLRRSEAPAAAPASPSSTPSSPGAADPGRAPGPPGESPLIILVGLTCSCLLSARRASSKRAALLLLERFCALADDDQVRLERVVPHVMSCLQGARRWRGQG